MTDTPTIGVVGSADVASALRSMGFHVVSGADFRSTATDISQRLNAGGDFPVVVADQIDTAALNPWTIKTSTQTHVVVIGTKPGIGLLEGNPNRLELPATINELLGLLRYQATTAPVGARLVQADGTVVDPAAVNAPPPAPLPLPLPPMGVVDSPDIAPVVVETTASSPNAESTPPTVPSVPQSAPTQTQGFPDDLFTNGSSTPTHAPAAEIAEPQQATEQAPAPMLPPAPSTRLDAADPVPAEPEPAIAPPVGHVPASPEPSLPHPAPAPGAPAWPDPVWSEPQPLTPTARVIEATTAATPAEVDVSPVSSDDDFFARRQAQRQTTPTDADRARPRGTNGQLVICAAGKGGVGKSVTSILLAEIASRNGLRAVVVDVNRGQADLRKYLRLGDSLLRTAYDAYASGDPAASVLSPADFGPLRQNARLDVPDFAIVLGPPADQADPNQVSAKVYGQIIDYARSVADIVIVDTQIIEAHRTDLWDDLLIPSLRGDAWLVGIADESSPGVSNLRDRLREIQQEGVTHARTLILATRYENFTDDDTRYFQAQFGPFGTLIGSTGVDPAFHDQMNMGRIITDSPAIAPAINSILLRVTGRSDLFAPTPPATERRRGGFFSGLWGGRR